MTAILGIVTMAQVAVATLVTVLPLHLSRPVATSVSAMEQVSSGALQLNMGTLYPGLMRLEQGGLVRGTWGVTDSNRRARFYAITAAGRRRLTRQRAEWERMTSIMSAVLDGLA